MEKIQSGSFIEMSGKIRESENFVRVFEGEEIMATLFK